MDSWFLKTVEAIVYSPFINCWLLQMLYRPNKGCGSLRQCV